jgi:hypothetical protein
MPTTYAVRKGDTLGKIAKRFYGAASRFPLIVAVNDIADPDRLRVGQRLVLPDAGLAAAGLSAASPIVPAPGTTSTATAALLSTRVQSLNAARLAQVHPALARRGGAMVDLCAVAGIAVLITQGLRTWKEQDDLYAKGRTITPIGKRHVVTKAKGGQSYHNFGLAVDIVVLDAVGKTDWDVTHPAWFRAAEIGKSLGLAWGGDWKGFKDRPHFQYTGGLGLAACRTLFADGLAAVWERVA